MTSLAPLLKSLSTGLVPTSWSYETGASKSLGASGEVLSITRNSISIRMRHTRSGETIKITCHGCAVGASLASLPGVSGSASTFNMYSYGGVLWSRNAHWTQDRFEKTPWVVGLSLSGSTGVGWSGTILVFTHTRSAHAIETVLANASKGEGFLFFTGKLFGTPGFALETAVYPKISVSLFTPGFDGQRNEFGRYV